MAIAEWIVYIVPISLGSPGMVDEEMTDMMELFRRGVKKDGFT